MKISALIVVLALALASCGGSSKPTAAPTSPSTSGSGSPAPSSPSPAVRLLSSSQLKAALLGLDAMPAGYSADPPTKDNPHTYCNYRQPFGDGTYVSQDYSKGGGVSYQLIRVGLRQYETAAKARASFDAIRTVLKTCKSEVADDGTHLKYSLMAVGQVGDDALGVKIDADGTTLAQEYVLAGTTIVTSGVGGLTNTDVDTMLALAPKQLTAYQDAAGG